MSNEQIFTKKQDHLTLAVAPLAVLSPQKAAPLFFFFEKQFALWKWKSVTKNKKG